MLSMGIKQYVNELIRIIKDSKSIIDSIFSNKRIDVSITHASKITDHALLKIELCVYRMGNRCREFTSRNFNEFEVDNFLSLLDNSSSNSN